MHDARSLHWFAPLCEEVHAELMRMDANQPDRTAEFHEELVLIDQRINGWTQSLGNPNLSPQLRNAIEAEWNDALRRKEELSEQIHSQSARQNRADVILDPQQVLDRIDRLSKVLATDNVTAINMELSLHIDRIDCFPDGRVVMRTCRLGALTGAIPALADRTDIATGAASPSNSRNSRARRRSPMNTGLERSEDHKSLVHFASDPNRFADLANQWFWEDEFHVPGRKISWVEENAEAVFMRRQESRLPYSALAVEFDRSIRTIGNAIDHYLSQHPGEKDGVILRRGGKRKPKFDLASFGAETRQLWESGWSKEKLAEKFECSAPTITKALIWAYAVDGLEVPVRFTAHDALVADARRLLDEKCALNDIAKRMKKSTTTIRKYLKESFSVEGKAMPDLRRRRGE